MARINRVFALVLVIVLACTTVLAACAPVNEAVLTGTPEPTSMSTVSAIVTPAPTPEPTPTPRVIDFNIDQTMVERNSGAEILFHHLTYTKNQDLVLTFKILNHTETYLYLISPVYANINGYGILFTTEDEYETWIETPGNSDTEISLSAKLDATYDSLLSIEQIKSAQFDCIFQAKGDSIRAISDEFVNVECPTDYVQPYSMQGDKLSTLVNPEYYITGISNDIQISSFYSDSQKRIYLTIAGTTFDGNMALGEVADFGHAYLAIDGVVSPYDDDVYLPNGKEVYLPNNGYCVVSFDVSNVPGFDYQNSSLCYSFEMNYSHNYYNFGYFSALSNTENIAVNNDFSDYSNQGETWIDENDFQFIYKGIGYDEGLNFYFDGNLINKSQSETISFMVDIFAKGMGIRFISDPVPPGCVLQMHSTQYFFNNAALNGVDIEATVYILGVRGLEFSKTTKTIRLMD